MHGSPVLHTSVSVLCSAWGGRVGNGPISCMGAGGGGQPVAALAEALGNGDLSVGDWLQM